MWLFFGITACFCWAIDNVGTKYFIENKVQNPFVFQIIFTFGFLVTLLVVPVVGFQWPNLFDLFLIILAAAFYFYGGLPYILAMQKEEATRVVLLWNLIPVITLLISWFFKVDVLNYFEIVGVLVLTLGAVLTTIKKVSGKTKFSTAFWLMFISSICYAIDYVIIRQVSKTVLPTNIFVLVAIFNCIFAATLFISKNIRLETKKYLFTLDKKILLSILGLSIISDLGIFLNQMAMSLKSAAIISALAGFQMLFVFLLALGISYKNPTWLREAMDRKNILLKMVALVLMVIGTVLVSF